MIAISELQLGQLRNVDEQTCLDHTTDRVGRVYHARVPFICDAYSMYCDGLREAQDTLANLRTYEDFDHFLRLPVLESDELKLQEFIQRPMEVSMELMALHWM